MTTPILCRRCGQRVFFYRNDFGSRVLFDELGGDWPKHDCSGNNLWKNRRVLKPLVILIKKESTND